MDTISWVEYYLLILFFKKIGKLNWPNRARTAHKYHLNPLLKLSTISIKFLIVHLTLLGHWLASFQKWQRDLFIRHIPPPDRAKMSLTSLLILSLVSTMLEIAIVRYVNNMCPTFHKNIISKLWMIVVSTLFSGVWCCASSHNESQTYVQVWCVAPVFPSQA